MYIYSIGTFSHTQTVTDLGIAITHRIFAHRSLVGVIANQIIIERSGGSTGAPVTVKLDIGTSFTSADVTLTKLSNK